MGIDISAIANNLQNKVCPEHGKSASISIDGEKLNISDVCCPEFLEVIKSEFKQELSDHALKMIKDSIKPTTVDIKIKI